MNHVRIRSIALVALTALTAFALAASSASALPEFGQCFVQPKHEGKYTNSVCTAKAKKVNEKFTGEFEWRKSSEIEAAKRKFSGTGGAAILRGNYRICSPNFNVRAQKCHEGEEEVTLSFFVECTSEENHGEISGTKNVVNVGGTFKGCRFEGVGGPTCQSGATEGDIQLNKLKGKLGFIKKVTPREVGLQLEPATKKGKLTTYKCSGNEFSFTIGVGNEAEGCVYPLTACGGDGVISAITPINTSTAEFKQVFAFNEETAENIPTKFEGTAPLKALEGYVFNAEGATSMWSKVGESLTNSDKTPEAVEIKAN